MTSHIFKYPRTAHIQGSKLQKGDHDLSQVPFSELERRHLVIEEKLDGANCGISFDDETGEMLLQSRGHFLTGGPRERHWTLFKQWAATHRDALFDILGTRYVMYAEWMYAKHTMFYDLLPHYVMEFDILDRESGDFLSTCRRRELLKGSPVRSVLILHEGTLRSKGQLIMLAEHQSYFQTGLWTQRLIEQAASAGVDDGLVLRETDGTCLMEGLYIKVEDDERVLSRYKRVRHSFLSSISDSETHWLDRPIIPNILAPGVELF